MVEENKKKIASEILYYLKRIPILIVFIFIYVYIYNNFYVNFIDKHYYDNWITSRFISNYDLLQVIFHSFFILFFIFFLFHRQIRNSYNWIKKYSK